MATISFSTLRDALRKSIKEERQQEEAEFDLSTVEGQLAGARAGGFQIVTDTATGRQGWVTQELNYGFHYRVRWAGEKGAAATSRMRVDDIKFEN